MDRLHFGEKIKDIVKERGVGTIEEEAEKLGFSRAWLHKVFEKEDLNTNVLKKVCQVYGVKMGYFLNNSGTYVNADRKANISGSGNQYGTNSKVELKANDNENILLRQENESLKRELSLLREMIELLKSRG